MMQGRGAVNNSRTRPRFHYRDTVEAGLKSNGSPGKPQWRCDDGCAAAMLALQFFRERHGWRKGFLDAGRGSDLGFWSQQMDVQADGSSSLFVCVPVPCSFPGGRGGWDERKSAVVRENEPCTCLASESVVCDGMALH
jgi:hypothetical protein